MPSTHLPTLGMLLLLTLSITSQGIKDVINDIALKNTRPGHDPRLLNIESETKQEVDEALDDDLETNIRDETKLSQEDEMALEDLAKGYNPMTDSSEASDTLQDYQDLIHDEEEDAKKEYGLFDLESNSEQQHLLNFKKVSEDIKRYQARKMNCLKKIPQEAWVLRELVICVGKNFSSIKNDIKYEKRKLLARAESRVRRVMADQCYSEAGLDLKQSRACDLMERDMLELLWSEMNYPALLKYHKEKYTFTHGSLKAENFDKYMGFFTELHRRDSEILDEMTNHGEITLVNIKKFIDDTTERYAHEAKENGYEFNLDLAHEGIHSTGLEQSHYHAIGQYDTSFNHPDEESEYHDYTGDHQVEVQHTGHSGHSQGSHSEPQYVEGFRGVDQPPATNTTDILDKYDTGEVSQESVDSEEYAQNLKDLVGYKEPEEIEEEAHGDGDEDTTESTKRRFRKRYLSHGNAVRSRTKRVQYRKMGRNQPIRRINRRPGRQMKRRPMRRLPEKMRDHRRAQKAHNKVEIKRMHGKYHKKLRSRNLKLKSTKHKKEETKKSIADILKDYTYKLPGLKSKGMIGQLLRV